MSIVEPLLRVGDVYTPHSIVTELANDVSDISEIYVVRRSKTTDGWRVLSAGDNVGTAFAALLLQQAAMDLNRGE